ncbi:MAG: M55 family metallopeptidase [Calditrichaeota bacterium]|nr:M55 family metallopeptidase [Calditrichota bacterium]
MSDKKIYISVDMEGITGVVDWAETEADKAEYQYFRKIMTDEVNAAIEGALEKGATEIVVRDAHGNAKNIIPDRLHEKARLLRAWANSPWVMMEGIDETFAAAIFIGYHAKAMTAQGTLSHTMRGDIFDLRVNGISLPELGWNALIAGYVNVPVIFVSGDDLICRQAKELIPDIEAVTVKQGFGEANLNLHPKVAQEKIRQGVASVMERIDRIAPFRLEKPYVMEIAYKKTRLTNQAAWYPGVVRRNDFTVSLSCEDFMDCMKFFYFVGF